MIYSFLSKFLPLRSFNVKKSPSRILHGGECFSNATTKEVRQVFFKIWCTSLIGSNFKPGILAERCHFLLLAIEIGWRFWTTILHYVPSKKLVLDPFSILHY